MSGSTSTGGAVDAGTCLVDGKRVPAGAWFYLLSGSCTICDPTANPVGWTALPAGSLCEFFTTENSPGNRFEPLLKPVPGRCSAIDGWCTCSSPFPPPYGCEHIPGGCCGGSCDEDAGQCVLSQNLGWLTPCGGSNRCATGPCCPDAGAAGQWCCGLIDGGESSCFAAGGFCHVDGDCCAGLTCAGRAPIDEYAPINYDAGDTYGICE